MGLLPRSLPLHSDWIKDENHELETLVVSESGASVYSASKTAREEFPDLDLTVRRCRFYRKTIPGPLAELVKLNPNRLEWDISMTSIRIAWNSLWSAPLNPVWIMSESISTCLFSPSEHVSISPGLARNIVQHRNLNGVYSTRNDLLKCQRNGQRTFEQSAGFLRVMESENPRPICGPSWKLHPGRTDGRASWTASQGNGRQRGKLNWLM